MCANLAANAHRIGNMAKSVSNCGGAKIICCYCFSRFFESVRFDYFKIDSALKFSKSPPPTFLIGCAHTPFPGHHRRQNATPTTRPILCASVRPPFGRFGRWQRIPTARNSPKGAANGAQSVHLTKNEAICWISGDMQRKEGPFENLHKISDLIKQNADQKLRRCWPRGRALPAQFPPPPLTN